MAIYRNCSIANKLTFNEGSKSIERDEKGLSNNQRSHVTAAHAREACVMASLGYLQQDYTAGSCFATSIAISLLESNPVAVANDLKSLLQKNKLSYLIEEGRLHHAPLNKDLNKEEFDYVLPFNIDVFSRGIIKLHEIPGIAAALTAMGVPQEEHEKTIQDFLNLFVRGKEKFLSITSKTIMSKILANLAQDNPAEGSADIGYVDQILTSAMNAGVGRRGVRLLLCWQNTLATAAEGGADHCEQIQMMLTAMGTIEPLSGNLICYRLPKNMMSASRSWRGKHISNP